MDSNSNDEDGGSSKLLELEKQLKALKEQYAKDIFKVKEELQTKVSFDDLE
jgi:hypothetical protein